MASAEGGSGGREARVRDPEQDKFMERDVCLLVDEQDRVTGTATKEQSHRECLRHRAFSVLLFDAASGRLLIQRRSRHKITFPLLWANTCCSHPLDSPQENIADAALGALLRSPMFLRLLDSLVV